MPLLTPAAKLLGIVIFSISLIHSLTHSRHWTILRIIIELKQRLVNHNFSEQVKRVSLAPEHEPLTFTCWFCCGFLGALLLGCKGEVFILPLEENHASYSLCLNSNWQKLELAKVFSSTHITLTLILLPNNAWTQVYKSEWVRRLDFILCISKDTSLIKLYYQVLNSSHFPKQYTVNTQFSFKPPLAAKTIFLIFLSNSVMKA